MPFEDTPNKKVIRRVWDRAILQLRVSEVHRPLYYFGLTGPEMYDILDWRDLLHRDVTSVEKPGPSFDDNLSRMMDVAEAHDVNVEVLRGDIERVMLTGVSLDNEPPRRCTQGQGGYQFAYDVVNLDFCGGIGSVLGRHRSIEARLRAQSQTAFTLFLTYNVRHTLHVPIAQELLNLRQQLGPVDAHIFDWYDSPGLAQALRLKAIVPSIICHAAASALMDCYAFPAVRYVGVGSAQLVHFAFALTPHANVFRAHHPGARDLVTLPMFDARDGNLTIATEEQDPGFDVDRCERLIEFLPNPLASAILAN